MATRREITYLKAVDQVEADAWLLPGIQRDFVWDRKQITQLFDSIMRGYPIGQMLFWQTVPKENPNLRFRRLATEYAGRNTGLQAAKPAAAKPVLTVLDGQQRLTALNIGLRGSHRLTLNGPARYLYIDLDTEDEDAGSDDEMYRFEFRTSGGENSGAWFPVSESRHLSPDARCLNEAITIAGLIPSAARRRVLKRLIKAISEQTVSIDVQRGDLDRVLNIFARANRGGTPLSYADLLVSTATARWKHRVAADEIRDLRLAMNAASPEGFRFTNDRIVKASLVLLDVQSPKFKVESFLRGNKAVELESTWDSFALAMETAALTLASFGLSDKSLPAANVVIPIGYYARHRGLKRTYATANAHEKDRLRVRAFVARTVLQRRYWTGAVDGVLTQTRQTIRKHGDTAFPLLELEASLKGIKSIAVSDDFIEELVHLRFSDRRMLVLLRLLFPAMVHGAAQTPKLDKDHIFPISKFTPHRLARAGIAPTEHAVFMAQADLLPNLQLLRSEDNQAGGKGAKLPKDWWSDLTPKTRTLYTAQDVKNLPDGLDGFEHFWSKRRDALRVRIRRLLLA